MRHILERERERAHRIRLESAEGKTRLCPKSARWRAGGGRARVTFLKALALSAAHRATGRQTEKTGPLGGGGEAFSGPPECVCLSVRPRLCVCVCVCVWRLSKVISHKAHASQVRLKGCAEELASGARLGESESLSGCSARRRESPYTPGSAARPSARARTLQRPAIKTASGRARAADAPGRDPAARMTARGAAGRCPPTVSDRRGAGPGPGWDWSLAAQRGSSEPTAQRAPTAEALPSPGTGPIFARRLREAPLALGLGPEAALQLLLGLRHLFGEGKTAYPIAGRGTRSHLRAKERGLQSSDRSSVLDSLHRQGTGRMAVRLRVAPAQWAFHTGHTHASRSCWGVGASEWGKFRCHPT